MRFSGKHVVVTGAASGLGLAIANAAQAEGATITAIDRAAAPFDNSRICDIADEDQVRRALTSLGRLDAVVNSAGIARRAKLDETEMADFDAVMNVNVRGAFLVSKYALPHLIASGGGSIINTGSIAGFTSFRGSAAYTAAKAGVVALTKVAGLQWAKHKIRVNAICPGPVYTPMAEGIHKRMTGRELRPTTRMPMSASGRMGMPEEIARVALFLASDDSSYVNATAITVDGGYG